MPKRPKQKKKAIDDGPAGCRFQVKNPGARSSEAFLVAASPAADHYTARHGRHTNTAARRAAAKAEASFEEFNPRD